MSLSRKVGFVYIEPSMIWTFSVEGSVLRYGPSVISSLSVEGLTPGSRTIRDMCLYRGWLALFISNCPRYRPLAWKVPTLIPELSMIQAQSVEGSTPGSRTVRDMCLYRGWLLCLHRTVHEIGLYHGRFASEIWTVRDIESQRGRFNS